MVKYFRHKTIAHFCVGPFEFKNHICPVEEDMLDVFYKEYDGLQGVDQTNIVEVANVQNEKAVSRVVQGALHTIDAKDASAGSVRATEMRNETERQRLADRENELSAREEELLQRIADFEKQQAAAAPEITETKLDESVNGPVNETAETNSTTDSPAPAPTETAEEQPAAESTTEAKPGLVLGGGLKLNG